VLAPVPALVQRGAERRQLTVMFVDLVGSTAVDAVRQPWLQNSSGSDDQPSAATSAGLASNEPRDPSKSSFTESSTLALFR
jgi:hypothetical protein